MDPHDNDPQYWRPPNKTCFFPKCHNTNVKNPDKRFILIRKEVKENWCKLIDRNCPKRPLYCCEDHINLEEDLENYEEFMAGGRPKLKFNSIPNNIPEESTSKNKNKNDTGPCTSVCRICLAVDIPTVKLSETPLQAIFEKVSNISLHTDDMRPVEACLFCRSQLIKCSRLMLTSERSENILKEISKRCNMITKESIALVDRNVNVLSRSLGITKLECIDNLLPEKTEVITVEIKLEKEDQGSLHTEDGDIAEVDIREHDSDEDDDLPLKRFSVAEQPDATIETSNLKSGDADATSAQKSESMVENEIEFVEIKIEGNFTNTNDREAPINFLKPLKKTECNICHRWYPNRYIVKHVMTHTENRPFKCKVCRNRFGFVHSLKRHIETVHSADEKPPIVRNKTYN